MKTSPTQRSLKHLRDLGFLAEVVEKWIPRINIRKDLFGFIDIVAIKGKETLAIQTTTLRNAKARIRKIWETPAFDNVKAAGWKVIVHGWYQDKQSKRWSLREETL